MDLFAKDNCSSARMAALVGLQAIEYRKLYPEEPATV